MKSLVRNVPPAPVRTPSTARVAWKQRKLNSVVRNWKPKIIYVHLNSGRSELVVGGAAVRFVAAPLAFQTAQAVIDVVGVNRRGLGTKRQNETHSDPSLDRM